MSFILYPGKNGFVLILYLAVIMVGTILVLPLAQESVLSIKILSNLIQINKNFGLLHESLFEAKQMIHRLVSCRQIADLPLVRDSSWYAAQENQWWLDHGKYFLEKVFFNTEQKSLIRVTAWAPGGANSSVLKQVDWLIICDADTDQIIERTLYHSKHLR